MILMVNKRKTILIVCHANKFRSPFCAGLLKTLVGSNVRVLQAGVNNKNFEFGPAAKKMRDAAASLGVDLSTHRAQQITLEMVTAAEKIIYMDGGNLRRLRELAPGAQQRFVCLAHYVGHPRIPDPAFMRRDSPELAETVSLIEKATRELAKVIASECN